MKNKNQISIFFKSRSLLILLLCLSFNAFSLKIIPNAVSKSVIPNDLNLTIHQRTGLFLNVQTGNLTNNFVFELEEDDDDHKNYSLNYFFYKQIKSRNFDSVSGTFYLKIFVFYEKTPLFILYRNFKSFLS